MVDLVNRRYDLETRQVINWIKRISTVDYVRRYWIGVLVKQGKISKGRAGQLLIEFKLV
jgi:hypothetical protein